MTMTPALAEFLEGCRYWPFAMAERGFRVQLYPWQAEALERLTERLVAGEKHVTVHCRTTHGVGKTWFAAFVTSWLMLCWPDARGVTTAPTWSAVSNLLWPQIRKLFSKSIFMDYPGFVRVFDAPRLEIAGRPDWFAMGISSDRPEHLEGHHSDTIAVLAIDECKAVPDSTWNALQGFLTAPRSVTILTSTPWVENGWWYDLDVKGGDEVERIVVDIDEAVRTGIPGAEMARVRYRKRFGESSPEYAARALAQYVSASPFGEIQSAAFDDCAQRQPVGDGPRRIGFDPAWNEGDGDEIAVAVADGDDVLELHGWHEKDLVASCRRVVSIARQHRASVITVDAVGIGAGPVNILEEELRGVKAKEDWEIRVEPFLASGRPADAGRFANRASEAAKLFAERVNAREVSLPNDQQLRQECLQIQFRPAAAGKMKLEKQPRTPGFPEPPSPNRFDACMMATSSPVSRGLGVLGAYEAMLAEARGETDGTEAQA